MSSKIKILYVLTKNDVGGAQKYVRDLAANLDQNQFETKIYFGGQELRWLSNKVYPWLFFLNDWLAIAELVRIYKKEQPEIIHLNNSKAGILGAIAAKLYNVTYHVSHVAFPKLVFTAHGWVFNPTNALSFPTRWFYIFLHKIAGYFHNHTICVSEYDFRLANQLRITSSKNLSVVHNGIDPNIKFLDREAARKELLKNSRLTTYDLRPDLQWVGSIGRFTKEKNYETLIGAAALMPKINFFIIGSGPEEKTLYAQRSTLNAKNVLFIAPTGEDSKYLKAFDIFVMSSIKEGLPYILLEAMAAGIPVVVTEVGGIPEIIKNHANGLMVAQRNPELLRKSIAGLLTNTHIGNELAKMAKQIVHEKFHLRKMIDKTTATYRSLMTIANEV